MSDQPIPTRSLSENEKLLRQKFYEAIPAQNDLLDKLSERLLTLELAIPGLYATVLKLVGGSDAVVLFGGAFYVTFGSWLAALALAFIALFPRKWTVDPSILRQDPAKLEEALGIEDYFEQVARYKRGLLIASSFFFFAGIISATFTF